jgi:hypothetical protein
MPLFLVRQSSVSSCYNYVSRGYIISLPSDQSYYPEPRLATISVILFRPNLTATNIYFVLKRVVGRTKIRGRYRFAIGNARFLYQGLAFASEYINILDFTYLYVNR